MFKHGPCCLPGPVSRVRTWWADGSQDPRPEPRKAPRLQERPAPAPAETDLRADLVERVRREIAAGTYDTPQKWEEALDRLLERLWEE
jgi:Anti-sigma-28 factor, FlgM